MAKQADHFHQLILPIFPSSQDISLSSPCSVLFLQVQEVTDGALTTFTLSDGQNFSSNVEPLNEELAEDLNNIPMFDLIKIDCAMVRGDRVILTDIEHKAISNKDGDAIAISGPLTAPGVQVLEELRLELLQVWAIRFGDIDK